MSPELDQFIIGIIRGALIGYAIGGVITVVAVLYLKPWKW